MSLLGKRCIVTGASRGIGEAIVRRFAAEGANCTLVGRNRSTLESVMNSLPKPTEQGAIVNSSRTPSTDVGHRIVAGDVSQRGFWEDLAKNKESDVDVLVNAAGITHYGFLVRTRPEQIEEVIQTNLMGTMWSCQAMIKNSLRKQQGCIINVASLLAIQGGRGSAAYAASKAGILGLTRSLAAEAGRWNIRVNAILPGYIQTQMTERMDEQARAEALRRIPLERFGKPEEVADAAVFLATNKYASNCVLNLDGGLSAS